MELPQVTAISYLPLTVSGQSRRIKGRNTLFFATAPIATHVSSMLSRAWRQAETDFRLV